jgi:cytochrome c oxidase cbb3-type subunit 1
MAQAIVPPKSMTFGEMGSAAAFAAMALLSLIVAAKAHTPEYAFHAYIFAAASVAATFKVFDTFF